MQPSQGFRKNYPERPVIFLKNQSSRGLTGKLFPKIDFTDVDSVGGAEMHGLPRRCASGLDKLPRLTLGRMILPKC